MTEPDSVNELSTEAIRVARGYFKEVGIEAAFFDDVVGLACKEILCLREQNAKLIAERQSHWRRIDRSSATYTANAPLSTSIPLDDTIPQNTEGTEILIARRILDVRRED